MLRTANTTGHSVKNGNHFERNGILLYSQELKSEQAHQYYNKVAARQVPDQL